MALMTSSMRKFVYVLHIIALKHIYFKLSMLKLKISVYIISRYNLDATRLKTIVLIN